MVEGRRTAAYARGMAKSRRRSLNARRKRVGCRCGSARAVGRRRTRRRRIPLHRAGRRFADGRTIAGRCRAGGRRGARAGEHVRPRCGGAHAGARAPAVHDRGSDLHGRPRRDGVLLLSRQSRRLGKGEIRDSLRPELVGHVRATPSPATVHHQVADRRLTRPRRTATRIRDSATRNSAIPTTSSARRSITRSRQV